LTTQSLLKIFLFPLGVALLLATFWFQGGTALSTSSTNKITPTPDRLAKPTLPAEPSQADYGAQVFWLYCMPCHGDKGQGLTDEFRMIYPPDHQDCWKSGCHGKRPYTNGWTLPPIVPRLIGDGALNNFPNAASLHGFISSAMPFQAPGTMDDKLYWQVTAFLVRQNGLWDGQGEINASNAGQIPIQSVTAVPSLVPVPSMAPAEAPQNNDVSISLAIAGIVLIVLILIAFRVIQNKNKI
jgi:hypothetical protein